MRVLLATDGSTDALTATRWLRHFPLPEESSVLVLTVARVVEPPVRAETLKQLRDAILADARRVGEEGVRITRPGAGDASLGGRTMAYVALTKPRIILLLLITTVPAMILAATLAIGTPVALLTKGTVRDARGFNSST